MKDPETATNIRPVSQSPSPPVDEESLPKDLAKKNFRRRQREILKGISLYFNPGEMVGIMGPSGGMMKSVCCSMSCCKSPCALV